jgi:5'-phosphate synthase pdxT subunit
MNSSKPQIGVLAVQGDFAAHERALERAGAAACQVRRSAEFDHLDGLIIPGGESTTMLKFLIEENLFDPIKDFAASGRPVFGTCAGAILLAREVESPRQPSLDLLDITVERNAYGRQIDSFVAAAESRLGDEPLETVFIRAPKIKRVGPKVKVLAHLNGEPVLVRQANILAATFHPELTADSRVHRLVVDLACRQLEQFEYEVVPV